MSTPEGELQELRSSAGGCGAGAAARRAGSAAADRAGDRGAAAADRGAAAAGGRPAGGGRADRGADRGGVGARAAAGAAGRGGGAGEVRQSAADDRPGLFPGSARRDRPDRGVPARRRAAAGDGGGSRRGRQDGDGVPAAEGAGRRAGCPTTWASWRWTASSISARSARIRSTSRTCSPTCAGCSRRTRRAAAGALSGSARDPGGADARAAGGVPGGRSVVLLDNFEDCRGRRRRRITDAALDEALRTVLRAPAHGVKVILTTRVAPRNAAAAAARRAAAHRPRRGAAVAVRRGGPAGAGTRTAGSGSRTRRMRCWRRPGNGPAAIRGRWRRWRRSCPPTGTPPCPSCSPTTERLPENVVEALVGEAFNRLDPLAQQVMQALAIYPVPVPPVAVDYLLQPFQPAIDSAPVLGRLVNMQFVRRDAGRYYLHQVDRDYALQRVPRRRAQRPRRRPAAVHPVRAARPGRRLLPADPHAPRDVEDPRRPRPAAGRVRAALPGRRLRHRRPGAARHRLRLPPSGATTASRIDLHKRLHGHLTDPWTNAASLSRPRQRLLQRWGRCGARSSSTSRRWPSTGRSATAAAKAPPWPASATPTPPWARRGARSTSTSRRWPSTGRSATAEAKAADLGNLGNCYAPWARSGGRSSSTSRRWPSPGRSATGAAKPPTWATSATATPRWARPGAPSSCTSRRWPSTGRSATAAAKPPTWATSAAATPPWGRPGAPSSCTSRRWPSTGRSATAAAKAAPWATSATATSLGGGAARDRVLRAGAGHHREIGDRGAKAAPWQPRQRLRRVGGGAARDRVLRAGAGHLPGDRRPGARGLALISLAEVSHRCGRVAAGDPLRRAGRADRGRDGLAQGSSEGRLAARHGVPARGELDLARATAQAARGYDYAPMSDNVALVLGIALPAQGHVERPGSVPRCVERRRWAARADGDAYDELDSRALALCGLALVEDPARVSEASEAFCAARAITRADGIVTACCGCSTSSR